ncbi:hypothetical protein LZ554_001788 [Drepanopeziza brunnea f. sp. 'monogermtubi']|nr:hypothetical protein LZ554_001788 [Drepanopeziza brunnea f. sp. 'monogermtubi']
MSAAERMSSSRSAYAVLLGSTVAMALIQYRNRLIAENASIGPQCQKEDWPMHKVLCKRQNYILRVELCPRFISNPKVTRTLSCPSNATLAALHQAMLVSFGWANTHLYDFEIYEGTEYQGRAHAFDDSDYTYTGDSAKAIIYKVLTKIEDNKQTLIYRYDFTDGWEHVVTLIGRAAPTSHFVCLDGEGHGCAEDVGGYSGWAELLKAYDAENPTNSQKEKIEWFETIASNKDREGLAGEKKWMWDKDRINTVLRELDQHLKTTPVPGGAKPSILFISLMKMPFFDVMYAPVLTKLRSRANISEVRHIGSAMQQMSNAQQDYVAVIVADPGVMIGGHIAVREKLVEYATAGGTLIIGFHVSGFCNPHALNAFFRNTWSLDWEFASYLRRDFTLNFLANPGLLSRVHCDLPKKYSMKALHLKGSEPAERIYVSSPTHNESPAIFANYGDGYLGWIGDVITEEGTTELLLTMCGI